MFDPWMEDATCDPWRRYNSFNFQFIKSWTWNESNASLQSCNSDFFQQCHIRVSNLEIGQNMEEDHVPMTDKLMNHAPITKRPKPVYCCPTYNNPVLNSMWVLHQYHKVINLKVDIVNSPKLVPDRLATGSSCTMIIMLRPSSAPDQINCESRMAEMVLSKRWSVVKKAH